jgi:hypothetical protein
VTPRIKVRSPPPPSTSSLGSATKIAPNSNHALPEVLLKLTADYLSTLELT